MSEDVGWRAPFIVMPELRPLRVYALDTQSLNGEGIVGLWGLHEILTGRRASRLARVPPRPRTHAVPGMRSGVASEPRAATRLTGGPASRTPSERHPWDRCLRPRVTNARRPPRCGGPRPVPASRAPGVSDRDLGGICWRRSLWRSGHRPTTPPR